MAGSSNYKFSHRKQTGAALVVALVLLAAVTFIGLSNSQSSLLQVKMITAHKQRNENFLRAEGALIRAEERLENIWNLQEEDFYTDTCTKCFTYTCDSGRCFDGEYESTDLFKDQCEIAPNAATVERKKFWEDQSIWSTAGKHETIPIGTEGNDAKFIVEFLCFTGENFLGDPSSGDPLFRITVLYEGESNSPPVMLQSTYALEL